MVALVAVMGASAQDYYYGVEPAPSMYAQQMGQAPLMNEQGMAIPPAPSMDAIMAGNQAMVGAPYLGNQQMMSAFDAAAMQQPAFVEQAQAQAQFMQTGAPYATEEAHEEEEEEQTEEAADEEEAGSEVEETDSEETEEADSDEARFMEKKGGKVKKVKKAIKKLGKKLKKMGKKLAKKAKKLLGLGKKQKAGKGQAAGKGKGAAAKGKGADKKFFKPKTGKPQNNPRAPSAKTPKAAGGKKLPPMPAPLPKPFKINCKKNPNLCIDAETPAEGESPGDHSPKAVFKKKMEVIKKSLMLNNRNIAQESKWIDQVELIMKQYALKVKKVKEHIQDERKAIKELLRQRRIILNEKKQKELELKLKMATAELSALTDALQQVQKKEKELGSGKGQLGAKIKLLVGDLKKLKTDKQADEAQALKKAD